MSTNNNFSEQFPGFLLKTLCTAKKLLKNAAEYVTIYSVLFSAVIFPAKGSAPLGTQHRTGRTSDTPEHRQYRPNLRRHRSKAPPDTSDGLHPGRQAAETRRARLLALSGHHLLRRSGRLLLKERRRVFLLLHKSGEYIQRRQLPRQVLSVFRQGGRRASGKAAF